jgi:DNA-binding response OmpR family regulator
MNEFFNSHKRGGTPMCHRILVVEDDANTNQVISEFLKDAGYDVVSIYDGENAMQTFLDGEFHLVILDIMLPNVDGITLLKAIREISSFLVVMLTAMTDEYTQLVSFSCLADDYITKPFSPVVLVKKVQALLRRASHETGNEADTYSIDDLIINFAAYTVKRQDFLLDITTKEFELLRYMIQNKGKVLTRQEILDGAWGVEYIVGDRTVDTHIKNLRKKLQTNKLVTVKRIGYRFEEFI